MVDPLIWGIGEVLEDQISRQPGASIDEVTDWNKLYGGAPGNTIIAAALQGVPTGILACVGNDAIGLGLRRELGRYGVNTDGLITVPEATRIARVLLDKHGDRRFHEFIGCADEQHRPEHLPESFPGNGQILHFGTISLRVEPAASATRAAIKQALLAGLITSFDVNYRNVLWLSEQEFRECVLRTIPDAHVIKMTEDELRLVTLDGTSDRIDLATAFQSQHRIPLLLITLNAEGAIAVNQHGAMFVPSIKITAEDSTGAGDAFNAGILTGILALLAHPDNADGEPWNIVQTIPPAFLLAIVQKANILGAMACTKAGAWSALPTAEELSQFMASRD